MNINHSRLSHRGSQRSTLAVIIVYLLQTPANAGPPYNTDDPEPVEYRHWEFYLATQHSLTPDDASGTAPHLEFNYGALPGLQLHCIVPLAYSRPNGGPTEYGLGDLEIGFKLRLFHEGTWTPMIGIFPLLEVPTGNQDQGLGAGTVQAFFPLWIQKSSGSWTTYGGGGFRLNPSTDGLNGWFFGWQAQYSITSVVTPGVEVYYLTADHFGGSGNLRFNVGLVLDLSTNYHLLFSAGRSILGDTTFQTYFAFLTTL